MNHLLVRERRHIARETLIYSSRASQVRVSNTSICLFVGLQTMCQAMFWAGLKPVPTMPERSGIVQRVPKETLHNPFSGLLRRFDPRND